MNFRADRAREINSMHSSKRDFDGFARKKVVNVDFVHADRSTPRTSKPLRCLPTRFPG